MFPSKFTHKIFTNPEPNDLDTIYKVLKKAGEISAAADKNQASGMSQPPMDIPVVNVPDYPDRPRRGLLKSVVQMSQQQRQGLTAPPAADMSSSGPKIQQISPPQHHTILFVFSLLTLTPRAVVRQPSHPKDISHMLHYTNHHLQPNFTVELDCRMPRIFCNIFSLLLFSSQKCFAYLSKSLIWMPENEVFSRNLQSRFRCLKIERKRFECIFKVLK